jgi:hypothetical protein
MAILNVSDLDLGTFLQIIYSKGIYNQTSRDYSDWEMIKMNKVSISPGRQYDFQLSTSLAPASTQRRNPGAANRAFPKGFRIAHEEFSAKFKEIQSTIEVDGQLLARAAETPEKYAEVWATQAELSMDGARRVMASELYRDGTGALGHVASGVVTSGDVEITLKDSQRNSSLTATYGISYAGWFELDDIILPLNRDGSTASAMTGATYLKVLSIDELNKKVSFTGLDANFDEIAITGAPAADEVLYRFDQQVFPNFSAIGDFGETSTTIVGLESLAAADGRLVHGMNVSGALAGSNVDAGGQSIDVKFLEQVLNKGKRRTGKTRYNWKKLCTSYQTRSAFIESKETDRRFVAVTDNDRGSAEFNFIHGESQLRLTTSEYIPEDVLWILPEVKGSGDKVLEYVGDEMKVAKYGNMPDFHFKHIASGQRVDVVEQHMRGVNLLLCKHPASILSVTNFKNQ